MDGSSDQCASSEEQCGLLIREDEKFHDARVCFITTHALPNSSKSAYGIWFIVLPPQRDASWALRGSFL